MLHYNPQHVSNSTLLIFRRTNCINTASGIITFYKQPYSMQVEPNEKQTIPKKSVLVTKQYTYNIQTLQNDKPD